MDLALIAELKRRRVFRALAGYGIAAFAILQIIEPVMHGLHWPEGVLTYVVLALGLGFPLVVGLAFLFDVRAGPREGARGIGLAVAVIVIAALAAAPAAIWYFVIRGRATVSEAAAASPSIAVLPFADLSPGKDQEYFSDGIAEEILDSLAQVDGLRVAGRTSSFSFKGKNEDLRSIGQKLEVANILEGSVRKEGSRVRVTAQLVSAADGFHLWSKTFEREMTGIFAVQDEIGKEVVLALRVKLLSGKSPQRARPTSDAAYLEYLRGKQLVQSDGPLKLAIDAYQKALAIDPAYAPAWAELATRSYFAMAHQPSSGEEGRTRIVAAAEKAVALDPELADAYAARGIVRMGLLWDWTGAAADIDRALALAPGSNDAWRRQSQLQLVLGRTDQAASAIRKAIELDPLNWGNWSWLGEVQMAAGQFGPAREAFQHGLAMDLAGEARDGFILGTAASYFYENNLAAAQGWAEKLSDEQNRRIFGLILAAQQGRLTQKDLDALTAQLSTAHPSVLATLHALRGERDLAIHWLEKAYDAPGGELPTFKADPAFARLRSDPRFRALLRRMNLPD